MAEKQGALAELSDQLADVVEAAGTWVVRVDARRGHPASGIVWSADGRIVAADHTLEREEDIRVTLPNGESHRARLLARDPGADLALLAVEAEGLASPVLADPSEVRVGQIALALGRPSGLMASLGVVSALGGRWRTATGGVLDAYVRSDAMLYPGFSGGPLVDVRGRLVAINSWHLSGGAGFGLPAATAQRLVEALASGGVKRGYLGIATQPVAIDESLRARLGLSQGRALLLVGVEPGSPADRAGLLLGDVLLAFDNAELSGPEDLQALLTHDRVGRPVPIRVLRGGQLTELQVVPGERS
ncbi:PDZ/DHR/GLGF domain protein [Thermobaculum terrenum ATCC BAA-798]|uniref:PDZ/DHR/GLGF domain protein n=1 Tax=Thermobaculum terrenum (strain ATCC BAA-798 / CCMEE 7001 / YNP1) TaxID=525904 RepID=D1CHW7_THET1|nr:trypsin-like peptidase domain-containing protein [Thermobaculum terrenum]ACZ43338.1 PDZ/DHR/GLGF domain protein [Thermobaculum terrenum ATCC BAA-798]